MYKGLAAFIESVIEVIIRQRGNNYNYSNIIMHISGYLLDDKRS